MTQFLEFGAVCGFGAGDVGSKFGAFVRYFVPRPKEYAYANLVTE